MRWGLTRCAGALLSIGLVLLAGGAATAQRGGGTLRVALVDAPRSFSILEEENPATIWPALPLYNSLLSHDPERRLDSGEQLRGELAESWSWSADRLRLTLRLRRGVRWHDGRPFTSADVQHTFELVRGRPERPLAASPRRGWYGAVERIATDGNDGVIFLLRRPQPGLLSLLASGLAPIYPAHVAPAEMRTHPVGTGPFRLREFAPGRSIVLERNPFYFVKDRPYLDGIVYTVYPDRAAAGEALVSGAADLTAPGVGTPALLALARSRNLKVQEVGSGLAHQVILNPARAPLNDRLVRQALNLALNRKRMIRDVLGGLGVAGGALPPPPYGEWGLTEDALRPLAGFGDASEEQASARRLLAEAGYPPRRPLRLVLTTRADPAPRATADWVLGALRAVGVEASVEPLEPPAWRARLARREFAVAVDVVALGAEDPDAVLGAYFRCPDRRGRHCNPELEAALDRASMEADPARRKALVRAVDLRLQTEAGRLTLAHPLDALLHSPAMQGLVAHHNRFSYGRMQDVWLGQ
jgi:peptide/nickel transport system substrate-binding protein